MVIYMIVEILIIVVIILGLLFVIIYNDLIKQTKQGRKCLGPDRSPA